MTKIAFFFVHTPLWKQVTLIALEMIQKGLVGPVFVSFLIFSKLNRLILNLYFIIISLSNLVLRLIYSEETTMTSLKILSSYCESLTYFCFFWVRLVIDTQDTEKASMEKFQNRNWKQLLFICWRWFWVCSSKICPWWKSLWVWR